MYEVTVAAVHTVRLVCVVASGGVARARRWRRGYWRRRRRKETEKKHIFVKFTKQRRQDLFYFF